MLYRDYPSIASAASGDNTFTAADQFYHARRTLDQFYYPALDDTSIRDSDQTISKWSGEDVDKDGKPKATSESLLVMVDQLWCWVIDEGLSSMSNSVFDQSAEI